MDAPTVIAEEIARILAAFVARNILSIATGMAFAAAAIKVVVPLASVVLAGLLAGGAIEPFHRRAVLRAMLAEGLCPGCSYDLLSTEPEDGRAVCPECGAGWQLPVRGRVEAGAVGA